MGLFRSLLALLLSVVAAVFGLLILLIASCVISKADAFELQEVSVEYKKFSGGSYTPLINTNGLPDRAMDHELNLNLNADLIDGIVFFNNKVHSQADKSAVDGGSGQYRLVGWNYKLGVRITDSFHVQMEHFSRHLLDTSYAYGPFPREDSVGFIFYVYGGPKNKGIF